MHIIERALLRDHAALRPRPAYSQRLHLPRLDALRAQPVPEILPAERPPPLPELTAALLDIGEERLHELPLVEECDPSRLIEEIRHAVRLVIEILIRPPDLSGTDMHRRHRHEIIRSANHLA